MKLKFTGGKEVDMHFLKNNARIVKYISKNKQVENNIKNPKPK